MNSLRGIVQFIIILKLFVIQPFFSEIIRLKDGNITYEYDNSSTPLGGGACGTVFAGMRIEENDSESVAFKELNDLMYKDEILREKNIYEMMGNHDSVPKFYHYFPETNETKAVLVMERIGKNLHEIWTDLRPIPIISVTKIGLQMLDVLEWMHNNGFIHNDLHSFNIGVGYKNASKIYLIDFNGARKEKNRRTWDLECLADILNEMTWPSAYNCDWKFKRNEALKEFSLISQGYRSIDDDEFRKQTFEKLRKILTTELEKHVNDTDYEQFDIGYQQDSVTGINQLRKLINNQDDTAGIEDLIEQGTNINAGLGDSSYYKPIHLAAELGSEDVIRTLIEHGAEINTENNDTLQEMQPLHYAARNENDNITQILIEHGANINATDGHGRISLHYAAMNGNENVAQIHIDHGAEINAVDLYGRIPLHYAAMHGFTNVIRILIEHDAKINAKDRKGNTPYQVAVTYARERAAKILEQAEHKLKRNESQ